MSQCLHQHGGISQSSITRMVPYISSIARKTRHIPVSRSLPSPGWYLTIPPSQGRRVTFRCLAVFKDGVLQFLLREEDASHFGFSQSSIPRMVSYNSSIARKTRHIQCLAIFHLQDGVLQFLHRGEDASHFAVSQFPQYKCALHIFSTIRKVSYNYGTSQILLQLGVVSQFFLTIFTHYFKITRIFLTVSPFHKMVYNNSYITRMVCYISSITRMEYHNSFMTRMASQNFFITQDV